MENQTKNNEGAGEENVFARSGKLLRSPASTMKAVDRTSDNNQQVKKQRPPGELEILNQMLTPKAGGSAFQESLQFGRSSMVEVRRKVNELYDFIKDRNNVHTKIKEIVTCIKSAVTAAEREQKSLRLRAETAEKTLIENAERTINEAEVTRTEKRVRDSPGEEEVPKNQERDDVRRKKKGNERKDTEWRTVERQKEKRKKRKRTAKIRSQNEQSKNPELAE
ncbi:uncharacterized protein LOC134222345 [Armigeres subalbatus]|uniref:uncharacterized protein LOC134222345 n=1 Tax=Armigeres subalbatus TaxID=124917 RepID=UPI002ED1C4E7